jgi:dTDP-4-amino-4,6-dideoxygalactose transaminase
LLAPLKSSCFPGVPLAVPYWNRETYQSILHCLISGRVVDGPQLGILRSQIVETVGVAAALLCGSGSLALEIALGACGIRDGDEVVLPAFCCTAVVPPIVAVGATPVLADCGDDLNVTAASVEAALTRKTKAVIVPHLFGNPAEIDAIVELVRGRNIRVIDDAAQALGAMIDGQPVGSFGDAGILSFGAEKVCFGLGGGAFVSRQKDFVACAHASNFVRPKFTPTLAKCVSTLFWRRWRNWTLPIEQIIGWTKDAPDQPPTPYRKEWMANLNAAVASSLMHNLDKNIAARRERVRIYREMLCGEPRLELIQHQPGSACLTQVIRILAKRRGEDAASNLIARLGAAGYEVQGSYVPIHLLRHYQQLDREPLPHAERVWADLIELPCEPEVSFAHVGRIADIVNRVLNS